MHEFKEINLAHDFPEITNDDKIVDFTTSLGKKAEKSLFAVVTESKKLFVRSDELSFFKMANADRKKSNLNDKLSFEVL